MNFDKEMIAYCAENGGSALKVISVAHYWEGGVAGAERQWDEPNNWHNRNVPGWFDTVIISKDYTRGNFFPYVDAFANDIAQLIIEHGAVLTVGKKGNLSIDGMNKKRSGIINSGALRIFGEMTVHRTIYTNVKNNGYIYNRGSFAIDKSGTKGLGHTGHGQFDNNGDLIFL